MSESVTDRVQHVTRQIPIPVNETVVLFAVLLLIWEVTASFYSPTAFPGILDIIAGMERMVDGSEQYVFQEHVHMTLFRIVTAAGIAVLIGTPIGIFMGTNNVIRGVSLFYLLILLTMPAFMWAFIAVIWFGLTTHLVPLFAGVLALLPYVIVNIWKGAESVDTKLLEMGKVFNADTLSIWRNIYLPHLLPFIFSTVRMVLSLSWRIILVVEIFGTQTGIGFAIETYFLSSQNDMLIAWILPVLILIFLFERGLQRIERKQFAWRSNTDETPSRI